MPGNNVLNFYKKDITGFTKFMKTERGFTLVELLVVISIIALLSTIGIIIYSTVLKQGRDSKRTSDLRAIQSALEQYYADNGFYPDSLNNPFISGGAFNECNGRTGSCPGSPKTYLNTVPYDPINGDGYVYLYSASPANCSNPGTKCNSYCLYARLENSSSGTGNCGAIGSFNFALTPP